MTLRVLCFRVEGEVGPDYTAEQTVVSSYVDNVEQGISPLLQRNQLKDFLKECAGLNCDKVVEMLNLRLCSTSSEDSTVMVSLPLSLSPCFIFVSQTDHIMIKHNELSIMV